MLQVGMYAQTVKQSVYMECCNHSCRVKAVNQIVDRSVYELRAQAVNQSVHMDGMLYGVPLRLIFKWTPYRYDIYFHN